MNSDGVPLYAKVAATLATEISEGVLAVEDRLPAEEGLMERFDVSRTTIRKAVENLIARGLVEIRRGKGTFVIKPKLTQELTALTGFAEDMLVLGRHSKSRLLSKCIVPANSHVAQQLDVAVEVHVYRIERVRLADGEPMSFEETYLPLDIGKKVVSNDLDAVPIFELLENKYEMPLTEARYQLEAAIANERVAKALGVEIGAPIFLIERTSYSGNHRPVDYEKLYCRGDAIRFSTKLTRHPRT